MSRDKFIKIRLSEQEHKRLKAFSEAQGVPMSEILRDFVKQLPTPGNIAIEPNPSDIAKKILLN